MGIKNEKLQFDSEFEMLEEQFLTNDTSITYANAWDFTPTTQLPQNCQCAGYQNAGKFLKVGTDGYVRLTAVEPGTGVSEEYVDLHDQMTLESAIENTTSQVADTLKTAKAYTDTNMAVVQQEATRLENLIDNLDATKAGTDYISVSNSGTSSNQVSYITIGTTEYKLAGSGTSTQQQSDYTETDTSKVTYIKNKPDLTIYATKSDLNTEISNRQVADNTLTNKITAEAETRSANDLSISQALDKEVTARQSADDNLQTEIDNINQTTLPTIEENFNQAILAETNARTNADQTLETKIENQVKISTEQATGVETAQAITVGDTTYNLPSGGEGGTIDTEMSSTSTNAVQNKVIKAYADDNFVPKDTTSSNIVYGVGYYRKAKNYSLNNEAIRETIPIRDTTKNFKVGAPTENEHCVNLEYLNSFSADTKRFAHSQAYSGTSEVWKQEMEWYAPNKISWLVLDCGKEATDGSKPLFFRSDKLYWGNDRFEYSAAATYYFCADFTWDGDTYRLVWDNGTCRLLSTHATKVMFAIGI